MVTGAKERRRVSEALAGREPFRFPAREADRRASVVLVLRPGEGGRTGEPGPGSGVRPELPGLGSGAPPDSERPLRRTMPVHDAPLASALGELELLLVRRAERDGDPWSGHAGLPGGHRDPGDAGLAEAGLRELREETGLSLAPSALLGRLDDIHPRSRRLPSVAVSPFVAWAERDAAVRPGPEIAGHRWTPLARLEDPALRGTLAFRREGALRVFPTVELGGLTVWGLTFVILRRFLRRLPREGGAVADPARGG